MSRPIIITLFVWLVQASFGQSESTFIVHLEKRASENPDSVKVVIANRLAEVKDPRKRIGLHHVLGLAYSNLGQYDSSIFHLSAEDSLLKNYTPNLVTAIKNQSSLAEAYYMLGNLSQADQYYQSALDLARRSADYKLKCQALLSLGWIEREQGRHALALEHYFEAIALAQVNHDDPLLANAYGKTGIVYAVKNDLPMAREYYYKALEMQFKMNAMGAVGGLYNNIGLLHESLGDYDSAIYFFEKSYHIADSLNDERSMAIANENIGLMHYYKRENMDEGLKKLNVSLSIWRKNNDIFGQSQTLVYMVMIYNAQNQFKQALDSAFHSLDMARQAGARDVEQQILEQIHLSYLGAGDHQNSLKYYLQYDVLRDSLELINASAQIDQLELEHKFESEKMQDSLSMAVQIEKDKAATQTKIDAGKFWNRLLLIFLFVFALVGVLIFYFARQQKKNAGVIAQTNFQLKVKNKEIIDSINYARRIQNAILPTTSTMRKLFSNSFVFYRPKDIVAGDFYWLSEVNEAGKKRAYFAVADCTGHGVPGAMVSVICSSALNKVVNEMRVVKPSAILEKVTEIIIETFAQSDHELKDGMDISLVCVHTSEKGEQTVEYAGANNALWIVSGRAHIHDLAITQTNPETSTFLHELKATKRPVGRFSKEIPFTNHAVKLMANELIYLFTDGYADQFGGEKNKKFKYSSLKKLILSIANQPVEAQRDQLKKVFNNWKGTMEQVDDVCVVGIRL